MGSLKDNKAKRQNEIGDCIRDVSVMPMNSPLLKNTVKSHHWVQICLYPDTLTVRNNFILSIKCIVHDICYSNLYLLI